MLHGSTLVPDNRTDSSAEVTNGIAMSRLHHTAFDKNLIGISPDFVVTVSNSLQNTSDGIVLDALKGLDGHRIELPTARELSPDKERLAERYNEFLRSSQHDQL